MSRRKTFPLIAGALWIALIIGLYLLQFRGLFDAIVQSMRMSVT